MKEALSHILDQSVCLTRRQMKDYIAGTMLSEEEHAAQLHLSSCPLCSMAMEGFEEHSEEALAAIASLNSGFLKEHYDAVTPQIHLNSVAPAMTASAPRRSNGATQPLWRNLGIAASILLAAGVLWFMKSNRETAGSAKILADNSIPVSAPTATPAAEQAPPVVAAANAKPQSLQAASTLAPLGKVVTIASGASSETRTTIDAAPLQQEAAPTLKKTETINGALAKQDIEQQVPAAAPRTKASPGMAIGGGRASGDKIIVDGMPAASAINATPALSRKRSAKPLPAKDRQASSAEQEETGYAKAVNLEKRKNEIAARGFQEQMESTDASRRSRHIAGIQAAKSYLAAGQKSKAIGVLNAIIAEGGPQKRAAKKMLRDLQ